MPRSSPVRTRAAAALARRALSRLPLRVRIGGPEQGRSKGPDRSRNRPWNGSPLREAEILGRGGPLMVISDPDAFHRRIGTGGLIGFGESYMAGEWDAEDLTAVLTVFAGHVTDLVPSPLQRLRGAWARRQPGAHRNTPDGARENIHRHYDLSNDLFALFLDETLTYSSALFPRLPGDADGLAAAQRRKIDRLLDLAGAGPGTRLLEIGTGWGELALRAAARGARVVSVTLSAEQRELAVRRITDAGYADAVTVREQDYREVRGEFDAVVSVEMIEAVGEEFWPVYFSVLDRLLAPGGRAALQAITMPHARMLETRHTHTWIQKYIFPGGLLPSTEAIEQAVTAYTRLRVAERRGFGPHYAETLRLWRERFTAREEEVRRLGFDETFRRMWTFYLAYCEAGFRSGYLDVQQVLLTKED